MIFFPKIDLIRNLPMKPTKLKKTIWVFYIHIINNNNFVFLVLGKRVSELVRVREKELYLIWVFFSLKFYLYF
jgi:hypothetical protein